MTRTRAGFLRAPEKAVEAWVIDLYRKAGCRVWKLSQPRNTMQTPGLPDLYVVSPRRGVAFWHECKAERGKLSPAQVEFRDLTTAAGGTVIVGGLAEARAHLETLGLAVRIPATGAVLSSAFHHADEAT